MKTVGAFRYRVTRKSGQHVHVALSSRQPNGEYVSNGMVAFTVDEWERLKRALKSAPGDFEVVDRVSDH